VCERECMCVCACACVQVCVCLFPSLSLHTLTHTRIHTRSLVDDSEVAALVASLHTRIQDMHAEKALLAAQQEEDEATQL
jgi:hypothetical protein